MPISASWVASFGSAMGPEVAQQRRKAEAGGQKARDKGRPQGDGQVFAQVYLGSQGRFPAGR